MMKAALLPVELLLRSVNQPARVGADVEVFGDALDASGRGALLVEFERAPAYVVPLLPRDAVEGFDDHGVELPPREVVQLRGGLLVGSPAPVDAVARDGVEGVRDGEDARVLVYLLVAQAQRVARAVPLLVVLRDDARRAFEELYPAKDSLPVQRVLAHLHPLALAQRAGLAQD